MAPEYNKKNFVDTHAHLYFPNFDQDRDAVINRAEKVGISSIINIGIDIESSKQAIDLAKQYDSLYATAGIHPNGAHEVGSNFLQQLEQLIQHPKVLAIGEIGLDYYRDHSTPKQQKDILLPQLELAVKQKMPVIIHTRNAWFDIFSAVWKFSKMKLNGVFHCFSGSIEHAKRVLDLGFYISFTGVVTFKNAHEAKKIVQYVPLDRMLLETDCPFMAPVPYRGKRCEPAYVINIAREIAQLKAITMEELAVQSNKNVNALFGDKLSTN